MAVAAAAARYQGAPSDWLGNDHPSPPYSVCSTSVMPVMPVRLHCICTSVLPVRRRKDGQSSNQKLKEADGAYELAYCHDCLCWGRDLLLIQPGHAGQHWWSPQWPIGLRYITCTEQMRVPGF